MSRPLKNNAEYFGHDAEMRNNRKVKALRARFGLEGYAVWCMILECLTDADNFRIEWQEIDVELLSGDFAISPERLREIVAYSQKVRLLSVEEGKLYSAKHQERMKPLLEIRDRKRRWKEKQKGKSDGENEESDGENEESKVKERKVKESKVNNTLSSIQEQRPPDEDLQKNRNAIETLPQALETIRDWRATATGAAQIESLRKAAMYEPEKYLNGDIESQICGFISHYWKNQRAEIQRDPVDYINQNFCSWLNHAKTYNKPAAPIKPEPEPAKYTTPPTPTTNYQLSREQAVYLIQQNAAMFADQFTEKHIDDIRQRSSRPASDLIKIIAKKFSQAEPFSPSPTAFGLIQAAA